jgi:hypothetical protein
MGTYFPEIQSRQEGHRLSVQAGCGRVEFDLASGELSLGQVGPVTIATAISEGGRPLDTTASTTDLQINDAVLVRVRTAGRLGRATSGEDHDGLEFSLTYDVFQTGNLHIYARVRALEAIHLDRYELPVVRLPRALAGTMVHAGTVPADVKLSSVDLARGESWLHLASPQGSLGVIVQKLPWHARWNDAGCYGHSTLQQTHVRVADGHASGTGPTVSLAGETGCHLGVGDTLEASMLLRPGSPTWLFTRSEGVLDGRAERLYCPEEEFNTYLTWEVEDGWMGPHITDGSPQYPADQLIRRVMGLNVLARKRFTWANEDFSLWHITKKDRFWEIAIKKVYGLMQDQSEHGGWYEGIQFYNLPPKHYQGYPTYIAAHSLFEAYDNTGFDAFLQAANRVKTFWGGKPPANSYSRDAENQVWHRWGGYLFPNGDTDERHVLNTHAMGVLFHAMYYERTGDREALSMMQQGINAVVARLPMLQEDSGRIWYALSQVDPTLERASDPPYIRLNLVPGIEDTYTVAASYRLMLANRVAKDPAIRDMIRKALIYWWRGCARDETHTYRSYPVICYAVAAGEIDLRFALALPLMMRDRDNLTAIHRGFSPFMKPFGSVTYPIEVRALGPTGVEPVFVRSDDEEFMFALVNIENPVSQLPIAVRVGDDAIVGVDEVDPRDGTRTARVHRIVGGEVTFDVEHLGEFDVRLYSVRRRAQPSL